MEYIKLNIDSTRPFYTDKFGNIYNENYKKLSCAKIGGSLFLAFILADDEKTPCKESVARIIYQTYFPDEDLTDYNIFKKDATIENPYQIDNLEKVLKVEMPNKNNLPALQADQQNPIKRKFYEKLADWQFNILVKSANDKKVTNVLLAKAFNVNKNTIAKHRKDIKKMKIKSE